MHVALRGLSAARGHNPVAITPRVKPQCLRPRTDAPYARFVYISAGYPAEHCGCYQALDAVDINQN
jgi:hypothetical protein